MAIECWLYFRFDELGRKVARPYPWIDADTLVEFADLIREKLYLMAPKAKFLQEHGWTLQIMNSGVLARNEKMTMKEAQVCLAEADVDKKEYTLMDGMGNSVKVGNL